MVLSFARDVFRPLGDVVAGDTETWESGGKRLSDRVWLAGDETRRQIDKRLRLAIARGDDPIAVARDLEQYLDPRLAPVRNPKTGRLEKWERDGRGRIVRDERGRPKLAQPKGAITRTPRGGAGSYGARRLARTEISRAFEQAGLQADELNPFVDRRKFNTSGAHKGSDICDNLARGSSRSQEPGVYLLSEFPSPPRHPHCMCFGTSVTIADTVSVIAGLRRDFGLDPPPVRIIQLPQSSGLREKVVSLFRIARQLLGREAA